MQIGRIDVQVVQIYLVSTLLQAYITKLAQVIGTSGNANEVPVAMDQVVGTGNLSTQLVRVILQVLRSEKREVTLVLQTVSQFKLCW